MASTGLDIDGDRVVADAGLDWDHLVRTVVGEGLAGIEPLSGIPGTVGGTPVQNVGAYGTETSDVLEAVTVLDRTTGAVERWGRERCGFGSHRQSVFKHSDRWIVLDVTYRLKHSKQSIPVTAKDVYERLGIDSGGTAALGDVRDAVIEQRRSRKMVLDAQDHDTWSVGSFFINPVLKEVPAAAAECPSKPDEAGTKLHAAWLIQHTGFVAGYGTEFGNGTVSLSSRHTLAVTNRGGATTADVMAFAAHIRDGVAAKYEIRLNPECDLINCSF
jgi:UDP-N-acetylmuramate dehydrogenase